MIKIDLTEIIDNLEKGLSEVAVSCVYSPSDIDILYRSKRPTDFDSQCYMKSYRGYDIYFESFPNFSFERYEITKKK